MTETVAQVPPQDEPRADSVPTFPVAPHERYELTHEIARGGMGAVYSAFDRTLRRTVAVKVILAEFRTEADLAARFLEEARVAGRLQHPGVPAVHDLGVLPDGRPFLAMKLIEGKTLDELLRNRNRASAPEASASEALVSVAQASGSERLLSVFEQICQTVGYAHERQVVHRDLKPANVMVGAFGEVQVMDWGLAKELRNADCGMQNEEQKPAASIPNSAFRVPHSSQILTPPSEAIAPSNRTTGGRGTDATQPGQVMGTIAYMPPEQARGEIGRVDARSDVFALGAVLCAVLTGKPPYHGQPMLVLLDRAQRCDTAEAFARLDTSGTDPELVSLCKRCLAPVPEDRPLNGGAVAEAIAQHRAGVEARLRTAERDKAAAEVRIAEQRKKRRVQLGLVSAVALLVLGGAGFAWWQAWTNAERNRVEGERNTAETRAQLVALAQEQQARDGVDAALAQSGELRRRYRFADARRALDNAAQLADGSATDQLRHEVERARADLACVVRLDDIRMKRSIWNTDSAGIGGFDSSSAAPAYRAEFASHGYDVTAGNRAAIAAAIHNSPIKVELVAALDDWAIFEPDETLRSAVLDVARRADSSEWTARFRDPATRSNPLRLWWLWQQADPTKLTPPQIAALVDLMSRHRLDCSRMLLAAEHAHPNDFRILHSLGDYFFFYRHDFARAAGYYRSARSLRRDHKTIWFSLGNALFQCRDVPGAIACYRVAHRLDSADTAILSNLGGALHDHGDYDEAAQALREAIRIDPNYARAHYNLGNVYSRMGNQSAAAACYRETIRLDRNDSGAWYNLGLALQRSDDLDGAATCYTEAIRLDPRKSNVHVNLGTIWQAKSDPYRAAACFTEAIRIDPYHRIAWTRLAGLYLEMGELDRAVVAFRALVSFDPADTAAKRRLASVLELRERRNAAIAESLGITLSAK